MHSDTRHFPVACPSSQLFIKDSSEICAKNHNVYQIKMNIIYQDTESVRTQKFRLIWIPNANIKAMVIFVPHR